MFSVRCTRSWRLSWTTPRSRAVRCPRTEMACPSFTAANLSWRWRAWQSHLIVTTRWASSVSVAWTSKPTQTAGRVFTSIVAAQSVGEWLSALHRDVRETLLAETETRRCESETRLRPRCYKLPRRLVKSSKQSPTEIIEVASGLITSHL